MHKIAQSGEMTVLGLIEFDSKLHRVRSERKRTSDIELICITLPSDKPRHLRKASKLLYGVRTVIPDELSASVFEKAGICVVQKSELAFRLAVDIYKNAMCRYRLKPKDITLAVYSGHLGVSAENILDTLAKSARYIVPLSPDADSAAEYLLENYGIAASFTPNTSNVKLYLYEKNFSLHIIKGDFVHIFKDVKIALPEKFNALPKGYEKGFATALLQAGIVRENDVIILDCVYETQKLT